MDPDASYLEKYQPYETVVNEAGEETRVKAPLGLSEYSPTNQRDFIAAEVKKLTLELPHASPALIESKVLERIQKSGLAVRFAQGALPAKLQAARDKYRFETAENRSRRRAEVIQGIDNSPGKSLQSYAYSALVKKFTGEGIELDGDQLNKLQKELGVTINKWKGYIPGWKKLGVASKETYKIAMFNILSGAQVDKDLNFLYMDPNDYALSGVRGASSTGDMSGVKENAILSALAQHISPYGTGLDSYGQRSGVPNSQLLKQLEDAATAANAKAAADRQKSIKKVGKTGVLSG